MEQNVKGDNSLHMMVQHQDVELIEQALKPLLEIDFTPLLQTRNSDQKTPIDLCLTGNEKNRLEELLTGYEKSIYLIKTPPQAIIFTNTTGREGSEGELEDLLTALHKFELKVSFHKDVTSEELLKTIDLVQQEETSALMVFIMSHGRSGCIQMKDRQMKVEEVLASMCSPLLDTKPKVRSTLIYNVWITASLCFYVMSYIHSPILARSICKKLSSLFTA